VEELSKPELTGEWEFKLAQMEHGKLGRKEFMREIAEMTKHIVKKAKEYDHDTVPGDYSTLETPCPNCGGVVKENYRRYTCTGKDGTGEDGCGFSFGKTPAGRTFELAEVEQFLRDKRMGPLDGFRSKAGWPFTAEIVLKYNEEEKNWKLEFDFGNDAEETGELVDFSGQEPLGACPKDGGRVFESGRNYVRARRADGSPADADVRLQEPVIPQQAVSREQMSKLLATGKTDLLEGFVSMRTRRAFKAYLAWDKEAGKVSRVRAVPAPGQADVHRRAAVAGSAGAVARSRARSGGRRRPRRPRGPAVSGDAQGAAQVRAWIEPSAELAAVIGDDPVARTEVIKKLWSYIKANGLQDTTNKRAINADARLLPVFGKPQVSMFELAGLVGKHLS
jgi:DNA topoisomerase-3